MFNNVNLFGKRKEEEKDRQIKDLRTSFPSLRRPNSDDALFEMLFQVDRVYSTLRIYISPDFPSTKPVLQVTGPITHAWLDQYKRVVGCDQLNNWTKASSLTEVFQSTLTALQGGVNLNQTPNPAVNTINTPSSSPSNQQYTNNSQQNSNNISAYPAAQYQQQQYQQTQYPTLPSAIKPFPSSNSYMHQVQNKTVTKNYNLPPYERPHSPPPAFDSAKSHEFFPYGTGGSDKSNTSNSNDKFSYTEASSGKPSPLQRSDSATRPNSTEIKIPAIPDSFPELKNLSENQLERLLNDEIALQALVMSMASVDGMLSLRDQLRDSNLDQAKETLAKDEEINLLYNEVKALQETLKRESSEYESKLIATTKKYGTSPHDCVKLIKTKMNKLEKHSESLSETFISGDCDLSIFLQDYLDTRTQFHTVSMKLDAL